MITLLSVKVWSWSDSGEGFDDELLTRVSALLCSALGIWCPMPCFCRYYEGNSVCFGDLPNTIQYN